VAHRGGPAVPAASLREILRLSACRRLRRPAALLADLDRRGDRAGRRHPGADRPVHPAGGVHPVGRDGGGVFHGARAAQLLPAAQRGRGGGVLLLRLPLPGVRRRRPVERRPRTTWCDGAAAGVERDRLTLNDHVIASRAWAAWRSIARAAWIASSRELLAMTVIAGRLVAGQ